MFKKLFFLIVITMFFASCSLIKAPEKEIVAKDNGVNIELGVEVVENGELENELEYELENEPEILEEIIKEPVDVEKTGDELVSLNDSWNIYYNYDYKYLLHIPKKTNIWNCAGDTELSDVIVLKNGAISQPISEYVYEDCVKVKNNELLKSFESAWKIYSKKINGISDLNAYLKERYDFACEVENIEENGKINIKTTEHDGGCFINYVTRVFYNEEIGMVYSFIIGQDSYFQSSGDEVYDEIMANSFTFLK